MNFYLFVHHLFALWSGTLFASAMAHFTSSRRQLVSLKTVLGPWKSGHCLSKEWWGHFNSCLHGKQTRFSGSQLRRLHLGCIGQDCHFGGLHKAGHTMYCGNVFPMLSFQVVSASSVDGAQVSTTIGMKYEREHYALFYHCLWVSHFLLPYRVIETLWIYIIN